MKSIPRHNLILSCTLLIFIAPAFAQSNPSLFKSAPKNWRPETIPFPLRFAPRIPYTGLEELRFAPGMFKPDQQDFFTYAFIWRLDGNVDLSPKSLSQNLLHYFQGLYTQVSKTKQADTKTFTVFLNKSPPNPDSPITYTNSSLSIIEQVGNYGVNLIIDTGYTPEQLGIRFAHLAKGFSST